jgi:hypothetical protein
MLNDILAAKIVLSHEHHSFCWNDIQFRLTLIDIISKVVRLIVHVLGVLVFDGEVVEHFSELIERCISDDRA